MNKYCVVSTTFADESDAIKLINHVLKEQIVACAQVMNIKSHYKWQGEIHHTTEVLVIFKTRWGFYDTLESEIKKLHPYEVPEIIAVDIEKGLPSYLMWIDEVTKN